MLQYWPDMKHPEDDEAALEFVRYEWLKHGLPVGWSAPMYMWVKINLAHLILYHMEKCKSKAFKPYGMVITHILASHKLLQLTLGDPKYFNATSFARNNIARHLGVYYTKREWEALPESVRDPLHRSSTSSVRTRQEIVAFEESSSSLRRSSSTRGSASASASTTSARSTHQSRRGEYPRTIQELTEFIKKNVIGPMKKIASKVKDIEKKQVEIDEKQGRIKEKLDCVLSHHSKSRFEHS
ncbi:unnamed protein product [Cuscuta campestris]|uniref:Uncharacterized protein n=1 Tax=Cuscuta campestris TaxID=132261 RepID=A0A484LL46_9ASTE|nr:unnamed protein product [Cuscuta campestris]